MAESDPALRQYIKEITENITADAVSLDINDEFRELQKAATVFLTNIKNIESLNLHQSNLINGLTGETIESIYKSMNSDQNITNSVLTTLQSTFVTALNKFFGKTEYLVYVERDGGLRFFDEIAINKLYETMGPGLGVGRLTSKTLPNESFAGEGLSNLKDQETINTLNKIIDRRQHVYQKALGRWEHNIPGHMKYVGNGRPENSEKTFYWRKNKKTILGWRYVANAGRLAEAYVGLIFKSKLVDSILDNPRLVESALARLADFVDHDTVGELAGSDVEFNLNNFHFYLNVKTGRFDTAKIGQYFAIAYSIVNATKMVSKEHLKQTISALGDKRNIGKNLPDVVANSLRNRAIKDAKEQFVNGGLRVT